MWEITKLRDILPLSRRVIQGTRMNQCVPALLLICLPIFIPGPVSAQAVYENAGTVQPGVVVEQVAKSSEGEKAGLKEGDILLVWNQGGLEAEIKSPIDLY